MALSTCLAVVTAVRARRLRWTLYVAAATGWLTVSMWAPLAASGYYTVVSNRPGRTRSLRIAAFTVVTGLLVTAPLAASWPRTHQIDRLEGCWSASRRPRPSPGPRSSWASGSTPDGVWSTPCAIGPNGWNGNGRPSPNGPARRSGPVWLTRCTTWWRTASRSWCCRQVPSRSPRGTNERPRRRRGSASRAGKRWPNCVRYWASSSPPPVRGRLVTRSRRSRPSPTSIGSSRWPRL
ncbi:MAG: hypothetical protein QG622_218 [Actinomycetota bacterium]|nr:hypothetical protein [Actinomycetota bacterium]